MLLKKTLLFILLLLLILSACYFFQNRKTGRGYDATVRYELVNDWLKLPAGMQLGNPTGIGLDTSQNVFIFHRAGREWPLIGSMPGTFIKEKTILQVDRGSGQLLNSWGADLFIMPHGLTVDNNNNVWVTDVGLHQVFKFTHEGKLLLKLGEANVPGNDKTHFNRPTDVAVAADGSFYVSDGYRNSRVIKFSANGTFLFEWGKKGSGEGEFDIPHGIDIDNNGKVYVADRENSRVQVFDSTGKFLKQFTDDNFASICSIAIGRNDKKLYAIDDLTFLKIKHRGSDIFAIDTAGNVQTRFGRSGHYNGPVCWYHDIAVDNQQSVYVGDILGNRVQKFKRVK